MTIRLELKIDRNKGCREGDDKATFYPVSSIFYNTCVEAGDQLIVDSVIESMYDEEAISYPSSRVLLEERDGKPMVGLVPR